MYDPRQPTIARRRDLLVVHLGLQRCQIVRGLDGVEVATQFKVRHNLVDIAPKRVALPQGNDIVDDREAVELVRVPSGFERELGLDVRRQRRRRC
jgi:hypothetical protein